MKNGTKSPDDKKRKTKKRKEANDNAPTAKAHLSEAKTVSEAKPVMRVQAAAPMPAPKPKPKPVAAAKPVKAAPAPKPAPAVKPAPKPAIKSAPKIEAKIAAKPNGKAKKDVKTDLKKEAKKASTSAKPEPAFEMAPLMSAFKPPFAVPSFPMPTAMMPQSLAEAGQGALAVNRKLVEMTQANMRSGLDFAMRLATVKTPMELVSLQMSYWQERMGAFARQAEELRALAGGPRR
jgi:Phasin protein